MRKVNLNLILFVLLLSAVALIKGRSTSISPRAPAAVEPIATAKASAAIPLATATTLPIKTATPVLTVTPKLELKPEPFAKELAKYSLLKKKVFLNPSEEQSRNELLSNERILRGLRGRLLRSPMTAAEALEQNEAIDMLLDAIRTGDNDVAVEVLRSVVTDGQVEDETLDRSTRENLAGIKAEVLFQWSALKPAQASELANLLPGSVSQKIWQNIVRAQQSNLSESAALAH